MYSKEQRNKILNGWTNLSILAGDVMNSGEMEEELKRLEAKATALRKGYRSVMVKSTNGEKRCCY